MTSCIFDPLTLASVPAQGARESRAPVRRGKGPPDLFLFPPHPGGRGNGNPGTFPAERFQDITMTSCIFDPLSLAPVPAQGARKSRAPVRRGNFSAALSCSARSPARCQPGAGNSSPPVRRRERSPNVLETSVSPLAGRSRLAFSPLTRRTFSCFRLTPEGEGKINSTLSRPNGSRILQ
jgi:hypothetical protein